MSGGTPNARQAHTVAEQDRAPAAGPARVQDDDSTDVIRTTSNSRECSPVGSSDQKASVLAPRRLEVAVWTKISLRRVAREPHPQFN